MILQWGKYKGSHISAVPDDYIAFLIRQKKEDLKIYEDELERRQNANEASLSMMDRLINEGYRSLAKKFHPDAGGDPQKMRELNATYDQVKQSRGTRS